MTYGIDRKYDLEELWELRENAPTKIWRDRYDELMYKIVHETGNVTSLRNQLIQAIRGGDKRAVRRINIELTHIQAKMNDRSGEKLRSYLANNDR